MRAYILRKRPDSGVAQEIFDAVEEARLAVIGPT